MDLPAAPSPARGLWSRRWIRRLTYVIVAGAALAGAGAWLVQRPAVDRWLIGKLDALAREECGLGVQAESLEIHPFQGRILLHNLALGDDLLRARLLEVDLEWATLLHAPYLRRVILQEPVLRLDRARLARIRLKEHPPSSRTPQVRLDRLEIRDGLVQVREPAWGLPRGDFHFQVAGRGVMANQMWVDLRVTSMALGQPGEALEGDLAVAADLTERKVDVQHGEARLGDNRLSFKGSYLFPRHLLNVAASGHLDLVQAQRLAGPGRPPEAWGQVDFQAQAAGTPKSLDWSGSMQGQGLRAKGLPLQAGRLTLSARGGPGEVRLERLEWSGPDGKAEASGTWTARDGYRLEAKVRNVPVAPEAGWARAEFLKGLVAEFSGEAKLPPGPGGTPWSLPGLERLSCHASGQFLQGDRKVGRLEADLEERRWRATQVQLDLPELTFQGSAAGVLGRRGLDSLEAEADLETDARDAAGMLLAWGVGMEGAPGKRVPLDMAGRTQVSCRLGWEASTGIQLSGQVDVEGPRWHGARADRMAASVSIDRDVLRVSDISLSKGDGSASGNLWLTWADLPKGSDQIDMTYQASRLPIREGLRAADLGDLPLDGVGGGTVRLHGPFDHILMEGQGQAQDGQAFGLNVPAVRADFAMDIDGERLQVTHVRVADAPEHLDADPGASAGPLALQGALDMDLKRETWKVDLQGQVDSRLLGLPGPRFQAQVDAHLDGPYTAPLGPIRVPPGQVHITGGRFAQGDQTVEGLEASALFQDGRLTVHAGLAGKPRELVDLEAVQQGADRATGSLAVNLGPDSADTAQLASRLTGNFLKDARCTFYAQGDWNAKGLQWRGTMDRLSSQFEGFSLVQSRPGKFQGDLAGMDVDLELEGRTPAGPGAAPVSQGAAYPLHQRAPGHRAAVAASNMTLSGHLPFSGQGTMALELAGASNLANLKTLMDRVVQPGQYSLMADLHPEGSAQFDLKLGGTFSETTLDGTLTLTGGRAVVHSYPLSLENLDFTAQFQGRDIIIPKSAPLRGTLAQGALTAWGRVSWHLGGISSYDLHASVENFQMRDIPTGFEVLGSLDANLKGSDQNGGLLSGSIWAQRTLYRAEINLSDLILANGLGAVTGLTTTDPSDPLNRIDLDLDVNLGEPWELDTNLLKLQGRFRGPFRIRGNLAQPGLQGRMELLPGGRVVNVFPAGDIILERGTVDFQDPTAFNPSIDVQGQIDIPPYLVTLTINGTLDHLEAHPYSTPSLRQDEIFAILINPSAVTTVGGPPGTSSQTAMNSGLASTGSGLLTSLALANFQEQLRRNLNLDRVNVAVRTETGTPEATLTVGKTVNVFGYHTPLVFTRDKQGEVTTISGQVEWRFGNFVFRLGASQSTADSMAPSGEIRHTWSPR